MPHGRNTKPYVAAAASALLIGTLLLFGAILVRNGPPDWEALIGDATALAGPKR
jgi:hypothetical protein